MTRILDIAGKDLLQLLRDRKTFLFLLIMPVLFTFLIGYATGGFSKSSDPRLPVGYIDEDGTWLSRDLQAQLAKSEVVRLQEFGPQGRADLEARLAEEKLAAAIIVPKGYSHLMLDGKPAKLILIGDTSSPAGRSVESEALTVAIRIESAVRTAAILERLAGDRNPFDYTFEQALSRWKVPPIRVSETTSSAIQASSGGNGALANTSPGIMLQFAIAGLLTSASIIVSERKSRSLQRLLTTATHRVHILLGHFLAIFVMVFCQFIILLLFGQFILKVNYLASPPAILLVAFTSALCIAALGLLIGTVARTEEQAIMFSLIPMFVLAGLGGAWVPLEVTGPTFAAIGHLSPVAWAMDGFKNVTLRGQGMEGVFLPAAALLGYAILFFAIAAWRFETSQEY
jgi:linearmycin/streptolysin S transport system permease protein